MSTRSLIGIETEDFGPCRVVYCHFDGYPEGVGVTLCKHYNTREKVEGLLTLGDMSSLGDTVETCCAYHRDRGEKYSEATRYDNLFDLARNAFTDSDAEYVYLWRPKFNGWEMLTRNWMPLSIAPGV